MLNRITAPEFKQVGEITFIQPEQRILKNGIPVFTVNAGEQELVRIEFIFDNVNWSDQKPLQAVAVNGLINTGTAKLSAMQIAEQVDYYGAFLQTDYNADQTNITLYSLNKHLPTVLPIIYAILNEAVFPENELAVFIQNQKQKLQVSLKKNDFLARKTFANIIFGNTPYGSDIDLSHYDELIQDDLLAYYKAAIKPSNCTIVAAGKLSDQEFELLDTVFGKNWNNDQFGIPNVFHFDSKAGSEIYIEKADAVQSALRLGNITVNRTHEDFPALQITNCVFGGYFGSRLMANIREDKGYTYGIGSGIASLKHCGYFYIATEIGIDVCASTLNEIEKEMNLLRTDLVGEQELELVRNYMLGSMLGSLENAFSHADKFKNIYFAGLDYEYYDRYIETIKNIDAKRVKAIANQYLNWHTLTRVVVGKK